jgi:hypothetical protein
MAQPIWITAAGSQGTIPEGIFYQQSLLAYDPAPAPGTELYYRVIAGTLPAGIQCSVTGLIAGVPQAVASLQGVPLPVNSDVTSKFTVRAYTENEATGQLLRFADRTFSLTISGNDVPTFSLAAGSFNDTNTATFTGAISGYTLVVSAITSGVIANGMVIRGTGIVQNTTIVSTGTAAGGVGNYTVNIGQSVTSTVITGWVGTYYDGDLVDYQFAYTGTDPNETVTVRLISGELPLGLTLSTDGRLYGYIEPAANVNEVPGYDLTPIAEPPYDFVTSAISKNYEFTLEVTDTKASNLQTFTIFVYNRQDLTADNTTISSDNTFVTADQLVDRNPFLLNAFPSNLGSVRSDNYFAYQFLGDDYDTVDLTYSIQLNQGQGLPPGLTLDPNTGWYYGFIPDQGTTEITYSFNIQVSQTDNPGITSQLYPFTLTITGVTDSEVSWITDSDLGIVENGSTSLLVIDAVNRGGTPLKYRLASGAFNQLPQGLTLLPTGEIAGRVTFNTFAVDLGFTTFDATQSNTTGIEPTTFDSSFTFEVNAYAEDISTPLYKVSRVLVTNGGSGYNVAPQLPVLTISNPGPSGITAETASAVAQVTDGAIVSVEMTNQGAGYLAPATVTISQSYGGTGAVLAAVMEPVGFVDSISVFKTFTVRIARAYNYPYQNLFVEALPPANDRLTIESLLNDPEIFVPEYIYRADDANFGVSTQVKYLHAVGLAPEPLDTYVSSLYLNHYWKNLILGSIQTAQALDANGQVIYEVVYSKIVDNLVNATGQSVNKIVNLPYAITDPTDGSTQLTQVYPNSLVNMRDQVIDVVGQISTTLPLWMTSKQTNGQVLGFTPSWVICYAKPGRSAQIAYYLSEYFNQSLNQIDFKVDRYVLDRTLSRNWDAQDQAWTPTGSLTTFDFTNTSGFVDLGTVQCATNLAYFDINYRTQAEINALGGIDGETWIDTGGTPPPGTKVILTDGTKIIFVQQENFTNLTTTEAWQNQTSLYDQYGFDAGLSAGAVASFDSAYTIPGGFQITCTATDGATNRITCTTTADMTAGDLIWFTGDVFGGNQLKSFSNNNQVYYVLSVVNGTQFTITDSVSGTTAVDLISDTGDMTANWGNYRMDIYEITIVAGSTVNDPPQVQLSPYQQVAPNSYVTVTQGTYYNTAQLYRPTVPGAGLTLINWQSLITVVQIIGSETTFDNASMQFIAPVDMYDTSDALDKYLVFPKSNILV